MKQDLITASLGESAITKLIGDFNADVAILKKCLALLAEQKILTGSKYLFNTETRGNSHALLTDDEMISKISRDYWMKFIDEIPLHLITGERKIKDLNHLARFGDIALFTLENIQNLIANLCDEKFNVKGRELLGSLSALSSLDEAKSGNNKKLPPSLAVIKNSYSIRSQDHAEAFAKLDAIRLCIKDDLHLPLDCIPMEFLAKNSHLVSNEWISIDFDLIRFKWQLNGELEFALSDKAMRILMKNVQFSTNSDVMVEWVGKTYSPDFDYTQKYHMRGDELSALMDLITHIPNIDENSEMKIPFNDKLNALVALQLPFDWAFKVLTKGLNEAERKGFHHLGINKQQLARLLRSIYLGAVN